MTNTCTYHGITPSTNWNYHKSFAKPINIEHEINKIIDKVCGALGITNDELISSSRKTEFSEARFIAIHLITDKFPRVTLMYLGSLLGNRHHATIIYNKQQFHSLYEYDKAFKRKADMVIKYVQ